MKSLSLKILRCSIAFVTAVTLPVCLQTHAQQNNPLLDSLTTETASWLGKDVNGVLPQFQHRFFTDAAGWNGRPVFLWSNGTSLWITDWLFSKVYAYNLAGPRDHAKDLNGLTAEGNVNAKGIWSDGSTLWVADDFEDRVFAYELATGKRQADKEFDTLVGAGNDAPTGMWSDGTTMWIADDGDEKLYAYRLSDGSRTPELDFNNLGESGNHNPRGMWSNGTTLWVADTGSFTAWGGWVHGKIFAYDLASRKRDAIKDFDYQSLREAGSTSPSGLWGNNETLWVSDWRKHRVFSTPIGNTHTPVADADLTPRNVQGDWETLATPGNVHPTGLWSNGETLWSADIGDNMIYAYDALTKERKESLDFPRNVLEAAGNGSPSGISSDGIHMYVVDDVDDHIYAYSMETRLRVLDAEISTLSSTGNNWPRGIWTNGQIMWVTDMEDKKLYAYDLASGDPIPSQDFNELEAAGMQAPATIWSDNETMWITDWENPKIYAYNLNDKSRVSEKDFDILQTAGNLSPSGMWSDGKTLLVTDFADGKLYAYWLDKQPAASIKSIRLNERGRIVVEYTGRLMSSARVEGPYNVILNATSPYSFFPHNKQVFFIVE